MKSIKLLLVAILTVSCISSYSQDLVDRFKPTIEFESLDGRYALISYNGLNEVTLIYPDTTYTGVVQVPKSEIIEHFNKLSMTTFPPATPVHRVYSSFVIKSDHGCCSVVVHSHTDEVFMMFSDDKYIALPQYHTSESIDHVLDRCDNLHAENRHPLFNKLKLNSRCYGDCN